MKYTLSLLLLFVAFTAFSQIPKPVKDTYVNDFAKVLSKSEIKKLNDSIKLIEKSSGVQLALVIVNKIPKEYDIEEYSLLIARRWKVGNKEDGLVYVAAVNQRKQRLEVARNLEPIFTAGNSQDVLAKTKAHFREKKYAKGLSALVSSITFKLDSTGYGKVHVAQSLATVNQTEGKAPAAKRGDSNILLKVFIGFLVVLIVVFILRSFRRRVIGYNSYSNGYGGGGGSRFGSFAAGAATGFIANQLFGRNRNNQGQQYNREQDQGRQEEEAPSANSSGNWGSSRGSSGGGSSSSGGFSGGGATSDW